MRTVEVQVFKYEELTGSGKDEATSLLIDAVTGHDWWDAVYEDAKNIGERLGFKDMDIQFSGFWSQGDGASFDGTWRGSPEVMRAGAAVREWAPQDERLAALGDRMERALLSFRTSLLSIFGDNISEYLETTGPMLHLARISNHYCHENTVRVDDCDDTTYRDIEYELGDKAEADCPELAAAITMLVEDVQDIARDFMRWIYRQLEKEYEFLTSEENLLDFATANDYEFFANGDIA